MRSNVSQPRRVIGIMLTLCGIFQSASTLNAQHTYYISKSAGLDSRTSTQAQSKSTPWAHLPGMPSCTSNCASYSPVAGDSFILKGGDTWVASDLGVNWAWNGTSSAHIYVGVDQTWFSGGSWARPIFTCSNTSCTNGAVNQQIWIAGSYVTVDNIELTGLRQTNGSLQSIATYRDHTEVKNCYIHGWSRSAGQSDNGSSFAIVANTSNGEAQVAGSSFHDNVIDGSDTTRDMFNGIEFGDSVYNNVIRYVVSGLLGDFNDIHSNLVEYNVLSYAGDHCNMIFDFGTFNNTTTNWMYGNVVRHQLCSGGQAFWINGNSGCPGCNHYAFNNIIYDTGIGIEQGGHPANGVSGTYYIYNNTVESGGGFCVGNGEASPRSTTNFANNHCINSNTLCDGSGTTCNNLGNNLAQTMAQANSAGYTASEAYAYSPTASNSPTVGAAQNLTSSCSGNLSALCSETTYPEYDSVNHVVTFATAIPRPASAGWNIGAYQFPSGTPPNPPTSLTAVVH